MTDQKVQDLKKKVADVDAKMAALQQLHNMTGQDGWVAIDRWLEAEQRAALGELAQPNCADDRSRILRGILLVLGRLRSLPGTVLKEMGELSDTAKGLRDSVEKWHDRGRTELAASAETIGKIAGPKE